MASSAFQFSGSASPGPLCIDMVRHRNPNEASVPRIGVCKRLNHSFRSHQTVVVRVQALPLDLVERLQGARKIELLAETEQQYDRAVHATTVLLIAASEVGWPLVRLAAALGISASTVSKRIRDARAAGRDHPTGLVVDEPLPRLVPLAELEVPVDERDWLSRAEAAAFLEVDDWTVQDYFRFGLLPNTRIIAGLRRVYLRADLERIKQAPRRGRYLNRKLLRDRIAGDLR